MSSACSTTPPKPPQFDFLVDPPPVKPCPDGKTRPRTIPKVVELVEWAFRNNREIRVGGAGHAFPTNMTKAGRGGINLRLDYIRSLNWIDKAKGIVEVGAGINLEYDPESRFSTRENGLLQQLSNAKFTLSELGGISAQTVGGYLSTGSAGGSMLRSMEKNILGFTIVVANGTKNPVYVDRDHEWYPGVGVSLGLLGIIVSVRFQCVPLFMVEGTEVTSSEDDCEISLFGPPNATQKSFVEFMKQNQYTRLNWYPLTKQVSLWKCNELPKDQAHDPKPYKNPVNKTLEAIGFIVSIFGNMEDLAKMPEYTKPFVARVKRNMKERGETLKETLARYSNILDFSPGKVTNAHAICEGCKKGYGKAAPAPPTAEPSPPPGPDPIILKNFHDYVLLLMSWLLAPDITDVPDFQQISKFFRDNLQFLSTMIIYYATVNGDPTKPPPVEHFRDLSWKALPMDKNFDYELFPCWFAEMWIPVSEAVPVLQALRAHFGGDHRSVEKTGILGMFEIYCAPQSDFWLSASSGGPVVRVDIVWLFAYSPRDAHAYFETFFDMFANFGFKPHWGKFKPLDKPGQQKWVHYLQNEFNEKNKNGKGWNKFMSLREKLDPHGVFLTKYWSDHLGIQQQHQPASVGAKASQHVPAATAAAAADVRVGTGNN